MKNLFMRRYFQSSTIIDFNDLIGETIKEKFESLYCIIVKHSNLTYSPNDEIWIPCSLDYLMDTNHQLGIFDNHGKMKILTGISRTFYLVKFLAPEHIVICSPKGKKVLKLINGKF